MHISFKGVFECGNYRATGSKSMKTDRCCCSLRIPEVVVVVAGLVVDLVDFVGKLIQCRKIPILERTSVLDMKRSNISMLHRKSSAQIWPTSDSGAPKGLLATPKFHRGFGRRPTSSNGVQEPSHKMSVDLMCRSFSPRIR